MPCSVGSVRKSDEHYRGFSMPKFLEDKLKKEYGKDSDIPYKILNAKGYMRGSKETDKGRDAEEKHKEGMKRALKRMK